MDSALDGLGIGLGFTIALMILGSVREFLGTGKIFGMTVFPEQYGILVFVLAPGTFIALGYLIAIIDDQKKIMSYITIFIAAVFLNNIVLSQFLGICPFLGVSKKIETALGMAGAFAFVLTLSTIVTWLIQTYLLTPLNLNYLQTITFILVIAGLVQMVEIILKKLSPSLYQALGVFLPLITTSCCLLGVAILVVRKQYNLLDSAVFAFSTAIGFGLALVCLQGYVNN